MFSAQRYWDPLFHIFISENSSSLCHGYQGVQEMNVTDSTHTIANMSSQGAVDPIQNKSLYLPSLVQR